MTDIITAAFTPKNRSVRDRAAECFAEWAKTPVSASEWLFEKHIGAAVADYTAELIDALAAAEAERDVLQKSLDEIAASVVEDGPQTIERMLALASLGKRTTLIGKARYAQLTAAEAQRDAARERIAAHEAERHRMLTAFYHIRAILKPWNRDDQAETHAKRFAINAIAELEQPLTLAAEQGEQGAGEHLPASE